MVCSFPGAGALFIQGNSQGVLVGQCVHPGIEVGFLNEVLRPGFGGGEVVEEIWPEMFHVWHASAPMLPEGQQAVERIGEFVMA